MSVEGFRSEKTQEEHEEAYYESLQRLKDSKVIDLTTALGEFLGLDIEIRAQFDPENPVQLPSVSLLGPKFQKTLPPEPCRFPPGMYEVEEEIQHSIRIQAPVHSRGKLEMTPLLYTKKKYISPNGDSREVPGMARGIGIHVPSTNPKMVGGELFVMATQKGFITPEKSAEAKALLR